MIALPVRLWRRKMLDFEMRKGGRTCRETNLKRAQGEVGGGNEKRFTKPA